MLDNILIVLVLYKIKLADSILFQTLLNAVSGSEENIHMLVYDNSPVNQFILEYKNWNITYIHDGLNSGVSKAYNEGAKLAKSLGKKWILLFDQDTVLKNDAIIKYLHSILKFPHNELFVPVLKSNGKIISPCKYFLHNGFLFKKEFYGMTSIRNKTVLNSGICISLLAFENTGGYDENVKLYFSDFNFMDRFRKKYKNFVVVDTIAEHNFSLLDLNTETSLNYFINYCIGARSLANSTWEYIMLSIVVFYRLVLLLFRFRKRELVMIFIRHFMFKKKDPDV